MNKEISDIYKNHIFVGKISTNSKVTRKVTEKMIQKVTDTATFDLIKRMLI